MTTYPLNAAIFCLPGINLLHPAAHLKAPGSKKQRRVFSKDARTGWQAVAPDWQSHWAWRLSASAALGAPQPITDRSL